MQFIDHMQETIEARKREWAQSQPVDEARRLGAINQLGIRARMDAWLVRAGRGAERRQQQREIRRTHNEQITS